MKREERQSLLQRCIKWREANIKEKQFILILSFLVGIFTAIAALFLKFLIHQIQNFLTNNFNATSANYLYLVYPVIGIFLAGWFVRNIVKDDISHGVTKILYAISRRQGRIKRHNICIPVISHLRIDITLRGYDHIGYTVVAFYIVFLGSQADVHAKLEIDVPVVRQKILAFDSGYIDQTIIIQTTDIQIAVQVTGVIRSSIGKSDDSFGVGELGKQIRGVLIEELSATK